MGVAGGRLISCASVGREEVRYALGGLEERIVVAEYRRTLPSEAAIGAGLGRSGGGEGPSTTGEDVTAWATDQGEPRPGR